MGRADCVADKPVLPKRVVAHAQCFRRWRRCASDRRGLAGVPATSPVETLLGMAVDLYPTEEALLRAWAVRVRKMDPDVLLGYEIQRASWGYVVDRAAHAYSM